MTTRQADLFDPEAKARDRALDAIERTRGTLVSQAQQIAEEIFRAKGRVSSSDVWAVIEQRAKTSLVLAAQLVQADPRWIGAVFRHGWRRVGYEATGSHKRPVAVWERA
jgi:hypothetical protein